MQYSSQIWMILKMCRIRSWTVMSKCCSLTWCTLHSTDGATCQDRSTNARISPPRTEMSSPLQLFSFMVQAPQSVSDLARLSKRSQDCHKSDREPQHLYQQHLSQRHSNLLSLLFSLDIQPYLFSYSLQGQAIKVIKAIKAIVAMHWLFRYFYKYMTVA